MMPNRTQSTPSQSPLDAADMTLTPRPGSRWEVALDAAAVLAFLSELMRGAAAGTYEGVVLVAAMLIAAAGRRKFPASAAAAAIIASGLVAGVPGAAIPVWVIAQVCIFSLTLRRSGVASVALPVLHACTLYVGGLVFLRLEPFDVVSLSLPVWTAAAASAGYALRSHNETISALRDKVAASAAAKDSEIQRRLGEERIRIARDLHDAVAHNIAIINVHSGAAEKALDQDRERAKESLEQVRSASRNVLRELQDILLILRSAGHGDDAGPIPSVEGIPALLESSRELGLAIDATIEPLPGVSPAGEAALYRAVQEALTNAHRHGNGRAQLVLDSQGGSIVLTISNTYRPGRDRQGGYGLIGMRERAESAGGDLYTQDENGTFLLRVTLPAIKTKERK
jgi:signal transduction histidine kinase